MFSSPADPIIGLCGERTLFLHTLCGVFQFFSSYKKYFKRPRIKPLLLLLWICTIIHYCTFTFLCLDYWLHYISPSLPICNSHCSSQTPHCIHRMLVWQLVHWWCVSIYVCLSPKRKEKHICLFSSRFPFLFFWIERKIVSAWYQFTGSFSLTTHTHTYTQFTPWGENECLYVIQQTNLRVSWLKQEVLVILNNNPFLPPIEVKPPFPWNSLSSSSMLLLWLLIYACDARHVPCCDKREFRMNLHIQHKPTQTRWLFPIKTNFDSEMKSISLWPRFAAVGVNSITSEPC